MNKVKGLIILILVIMIPVNVFSAGEKEKEGEGVVTLVVWDYKYGEEKMGSAMKAIDDLFIKEHPNVIIEHVAQPHDEYYDILRAAVASGSGPDVAMGAVDPKMWVFADYLVSLDSYIDEWRDEISEDVWLSCTTDNDFNGGIKLVPLTVQGLGWYYNKALFEKAGLNADQPPTDWSDFLSACAKLKSSGITPIIWGNTPSYGSEWLRRSLATNFYGKEGIEGFRTGISNFSDPEFVTIIEMINELSVKEYLDPRGAGQPIFMDSVDQFKAGKGALYLGLISDIAHWKDYADALGKDNIGYFPNINHPGAKYKDRQMNQLAGIGYGIFSYSENIDLAAEYLRAYASGEGPKILVNETGAMVPNVNVDLSSLGYPQLMEILGYLKTNSTPDLKRYITSEVRQKSIDYDSLIFNAHELSVDEYIKKVQAILESSR